MNFFEKILYFLQHLKMREPESFGWFHWLWIFLTIFSVVVLVKRRVKHDEKQLKIILFTYGVVAFILELIKQLIWAFNYDSVNKIVTFEYEWYAFPFQLCTTPIFVSLICCFLKDNKIRRAMLSYMAFVTILGSLATAIIPDSCFVSDILVNIHTMWLHFGSLVVSVYLLISNEVKLDIINLKNALLVFLIFVGIAQVLNFAIYGSGLLNGQTFNMFYISPYFESTLPVFDIIWQSVAYPLFLLTYLCVIATGSFIIYFVVWGIKKLVSVLKSSSKDNKVIF